LSFQLCGERTAGRGKTPVPCKRSTSHLSLKPKSTSFNSKLYFLQNSYSSLKLYCCYFLKLTTAYSSQLTTQIDDNRRIGSSDDRCYLEIQIMSAVNRGLRQASRTLRLPQRFSQKSALTPLSARCSQLSPVSALTRASSRNHNNFSTMASLQSNAPASAPVDLKSYDPEIVDIADYVHNKPIDSDLAVSVSLTLPTPLGCQDKFGRGSGNPAANRPFATPNSSTRHDGSLSTRSAAVSRA